MAKLLIIEDDLEISSLLSDFLEEKGFETVCLHQGLHIREMIEKQTFDLVLLDLMLPFKSGDQILTQIRTHSTIPVIIISAKGTTQDKIDLLRLGADDYITKPFDLEEALARIESNLRRVQYQDTPGQILKFRDLVLDLENHTVCLKGTELILTAKEYGILELLMKYPDKIFSKSNLFQSVWNTEFLSEDNTLNVHISNLRNKLKSICPGEEYIDTVWGIGYRLHKAGESQSPALLKF